MQNKQNNSLALMVPPPEATNQRNLLSPAPPLSRNKRLTGTDVAAALLSGPFAAAMAIARRQHNSEPSTAPPASAPAADGRAKAFVRVVYACIDRNDRGFVTLDDLREYLSKFADVAGLLRSLDVPSIEEAAALLLGLSNANGDQRIRCVTATASRCARGNRSARVLPRGDAPTAG